MGASHRRHPGEAALPTSAAARLLQLAQEHKSSVPGGHPCVCLTSNQKPQGGDSSEPEGAGPPSRPLSLSLRLLPCFDCSV